MERGTATEAEADERACLSSLADLVRRRIDEMGWTLKAVADRSGLSIASVWALREGSRGKRPQPSTLLKLAAGLDLPPEQLFAVLEFNSSDDGHGREQGHLRVYRRLDEKAKTAVEALAIELLSRQPLGPPGQRIAQRQPLSDEGDTIVLPT